MIGDWDNLRPENQVEYSRIGEREKILVEGRLDRGRCLNNARDYTFKKGANEQENENDKFQEKFRLVLFLPT